MQTLHSLGAVKRAKALPPPFVIFLEETIVGTDDDFLKIEIGCILFLIYTRSSFGDAQRIQKEPQVQGDYLATEAKTYKTSGARSRRGMALPILAPNRGLAKEWGKP